MADPTKLMKLLEIAEKFGVKRSKVIGTQGNIVPFKKPSLVDISVDEFKLKDSVDQGNITMDKVKQEMEETVKLALSKNLDDVELNRALNNAVNLDRVFFPPSAEVIAAGSGKPVTGKGLEEIIQKGGLMAPPNTPLGKADFQIKRAKQSVEDIKNEFDISNLIKGAGKDQLSLNKLHNEGLVRAVTRQILSEDIKAGKIKSLTLDDLGTSREPIDYFRKIYGESALEQLDSIAPDFNRFYTEKEATDFARTKFKFEPNEARTEESVSYEELKKAKETKNERSFLEKLFGINKNKEPAEVLNLTKEGDKRKNVDQLIDEYNANQDKTRLLDEEGGSKISYEEFQDIQKRNEEIAKELEKKGVSSTIEEEVKPEGIVVPFRKKFTKPEPEEKAEGGRIGYEKGKRVISSIDKLLEQLNTKLSKKKSMETVNPKTGEVTVPKKPIRKAEEPTGVTVMDQEPDIVDKKTALKNKSRQLTRDEIADYEEQLGDSETWLSEGTVEEAEKALKRRKAEEAYYYRQYKMGKLDPAPGEQTQARMKFLQKKLEEAELTKDRRLITPNEINELDDLENIFAKDLTQTNEQALENEMNRVLNQYDKSMFIKDVQGMVDVSNPANAEKMALLLKRDHPEIYNKIFKLTEDINQKQVLDEFDITGREPNAKGGIAGLL